MHRCACGTDFCFECGARCHDCECSDSVLGEYLDDNRRAHAWTKGAGGLDAEVEVQSWPKHEKVIGNDADDADKADKKPSCDHSRAGLAHGKARCHGCVRIADPLARCLECQIELCAVCLPQKSESETEESEMEGYRTEESEMEEDSEEE
jgi:hypothetical protein